MAPISYYLIGSIPSLVNEGRFPERGDPLMLGYKSTFIPSLPLLFWVVICEHTPKAWLEMDLYFNISLFGPMWLYIFGPFWDTVIYSLAY